ncbi:hypothetical protein E2C01_028851 [Portunus trituberculatus]|uniref:Uncharacterized protein n=1 Tax=Portunus trituberculatus TaxID=210409 RepID=A0A5B7EQL9_PORTR|nr:hypothetical protein [Portunus trituberculatus]
MSRWNGIQEITYERKINCIFTSPSQCQQGVGFRRVTGTGAKVQPCRRLVSRCSLITPLAHRRRLLHTLTPTHLSLSTSFFNLNPTNQLYTRSHPRHSTQSSSLHTTTPIPTHFSILPTLRTVH